MSYFKLKSLFFVFFLFGVTFLYGKTQLPPKKLLYIVSDTSIPFWQIVSKGIVNEGTKLGYQIDVISSNNSGKKELESVVLGIKNKIAGIIISPTTSSACVTVLQLAKKSKIPVVIADIGTDGGEYLSYISSDNKAGAYALGKILTKRMYQLGYQKGGVGIISIPQKRLNGQLRTEGFLKALKEANIKSLDLKQQITFSYEETYNYTEEMIKKFPTLKAIWLQGSDKYKGALDAIEKSGKKGKILLVVFDAEPEFLELIPKDVIVGAAMQQPYLMGKEAIRSIDNFLTNKKVAKKIQMPILAISKENIKKELPLIKENVLGIVPIQ